MRGYFIPGIWSGGMVLALDARRVQFPESPPSVGSWNGMSVPVPTVEPSKFETDMFRQCSLPPNKDVSEMSLFDILSSLNSPDLYRQLHSQITSFSTCLFYLIFLHFTTTESRKHGLVVGSPRVLGIMDRSKNTVKNR